MNKLERIAGELIGVSDIDDAHAAWWKEEYGDLLVRAVRQFGAVANAVLEARTDDDGYVFDTLGEPTIDKAYSAVELDVLELLKETK